MLGKVALTAACYLAFNPKGNRIASKGFRLACKLGDLAVGAMPTPVGKVFSGAQRGFSELMREEVYDAPHEAETNHMPAEQEPLPGDPGQELEMGSV